MPPRLAPPSPSDIALYLALLEATPQRLADFAEGRSDADLARLAAMSVTASTAPETIKTQLHKEIDDWLSAPT